jgi:hypothetical protein
MPARTLPDSTITNLSHFLFSEYVACAYWFWLVPAILLSSPGVYWRLSYLSALLSYSSMNGGQGLPALGDVWIDNVSCYGEKIGNGDKFRSVMMDIWTETDVLVERGNMHMGLLLVFT